jgi:hypothetical protein
MRLREVAAVVVTHVAMRALMLKLRIHQVLMLPNQSLSQDLL